MPTAPKKVYSVSNKGRRVPTDPNKVYSVSTRGGVPTAPKKVYSVSGGDASGAGPGTIRMWRQSPTENFSRTLRSSDNGIIGCRGLTKFTAFLTRGGVQAPQKRLQRLDHGGGFCAMSQDRGPCIATGAVVLESVHRPPIGAQAPQKRLRAFATRPRTLGTQRPCLKFVRERTHSDPAIRFLWSPHDARSTSGLCRSGGL